eukprot:scaffold37787_cov153-Skeletonema_marinoi.AAC.7
MGQRERDTARSSFHIAVLSQEDIPGLQLKDSYIRFLTTQTHRSKTVTNPQCIHTQLNYSYESQA